MENEGKLLNFCSKRKKMTVYTKNSICNQNCFSATPIMNICFKISKEIASNVAIFKEKNASKVLDKNVVWFIIRKFIHITVKVKSLQPFEKVIDNSSFI